MMNLPEAYQIKLNKILGEDYQQYLTAFDHKYGQTMRMNQLKTEPADFIRRLPFSDCREVPWCQKGYYTSQEERISLHPYYAAGLYYIQEPSAMAPAEFLPVKPGDKVLDLCAAPGGKSVALAGKLQGEGLLVSNDISASRCKALLKNVELAGIANAMITCEKAENLAREFPAYFDCILVDAPCSGEGMFRRDPAMIKGWSEEEVDKYSQIQRELLHQADKMLKPGGYLMYSTCTYSPEENEQSVETLLTSDYAYELCKLPLYEGVAQGMPEYSQSGKEELKYCRRFWNHRVDGEGQFAALLHKKEESDDCQVTAVIPSGKGDKVTPEMALFMADVNLDIDPARIYRQQERVFYLPESQIQKKKLRFIRSGLYLGDCKKNRFEPSQALAMALKDTDYPNVIRLQVEDDRVKRYLKCETIQDESAKDGWVLVCLEEYPLGWGKARNGVIKNKYAPGWRW